MAKRTLAAQITEALDGETRAWASRLGWEIIAAGDEGYTVGAPGQKNLRVHTTLTTIENALARREQTLKAEADRRQALTDGRTRMAARKATKQAAAVTAAVSGRGGYLVGESLDLSWALDSHPLPAVRMCIITPGDAKALLDRANTANYRNIRDTQTTRYVKTMRDGGWKLTHQGIAFDTFGALIDGQHRLKACMISKVAITVMVFVGLDPGIVGFVDEGRNRTANDLLKHLGFNTSAALAPAVRLILAYSTDSPIYTYRQGIANSAVAAFVEKNPAVADHARRGSSLQSTPRGDQYGTVNGVAMGAVWFMLADLADNEHIEAFMFALATGYQHKGNPNSADEQRMLMATSDPRTRVRAWLHDAGDRSGLNRHRTPALTQAVLIITAWNHMCAGEKPRRLAYDPDNPVYPWPAEPTAALRRALA